LKKEDIEILTDSICDKYIEEAVNYKQAKRYSKKRIILIAAACLLCVCIVIPISLHTLYPNKAESGEQPPESNNPSEEASYDYSYPENIATEGSDSTNISLYSSRYGDEELYRSEVAYEYSWDERELYEQYERLVYNGVQYNNIRRGIVESYIGATLGTHSFYGWDYITGLDASTEFEIFEIKGVSSKYRVAAKLGNNYYCFVSTSKVPNSTLGEYINALNLNENMPISRFSRYELENDSLELRTYKIHDEEFVWKRLFECLNAPYVEEMSVESAWDWSNKHSGISFKVRSMPLGILGTVYVSNDGYLRFSDGTTFNIGKVKANEIIDYAENNRSPAKHVFNTYWLYGYITEITDEYILFDDTRLIREGEEGVIYRVNIDCNVVKRAIKYENLKEGSLLVVFVNYYGYIDEENQNTVYGVNDIARGHISDGDIIVYE